MVILNDGSPTYFNLWCGTESVIDITIASADLATISIYDYEKDGDLRSSDHLPITTLINAFKNRNLTSQSINDTSKEEKLIQVAVEKLCPPSCSPEDPTLGDLVKEDASNEERLHHWLDDPIFIDEIFSALDSMKKNSAPGLDQLDYVILTALPEFFWSKFCEIFNKLFNSGSFPEDWHTSFVIFIPKPGGKGVRPISLISCVLKIMEKCLYNRLRWHLEHNDFLSDSQLGFRNAKSCLDSVITLTNNIKAGFLKGAYTVAAFLDIDGAFDNVLPHILVKDQFNIGVPAHFRKFILNLVSNRFVFYAQNGEKIGPLYSRKGTPQGSILSPTLFNIYIKDITKLINPDCRILLYADNVVIYSINKNLDAAIYSINDSIHKIYEFLLARGLSLSSVKSQSMIFSHKKKLPMFIPDIAIMDNPIPYCEVVRFLGILLDPRLSSRPHFLYIISKCRKALSVMLALAGIWWGAHPQQLNMIYKGLIRSNMDYRCQIYQLRGNLTIFEKLQRIQYKAIRIAFGYHQSTPINTLLDKAKEPLLQLRFKYLTSKLVLKNIAQEFSPVTFSLDDIFPLTRSQHNYEIATKSIPSYNYFHSILEQYKELRRDAISFYTDGSKSAYGYVGAGVFSPDLNLQIMHKLPAETTIFSAEAWAILQVLITISQENFSKVIIFSDSKSVLENVCSSAAKQQNYIIPRIREKIHQFSSRGVNLYLAWIPSHRGITGNEQADKIAKEAAKRGYVPNFKIPHSDFYSVAKETLCNQFEEQPSDTMSLPRSTINHKQCKLNRDYTVLFDVVMAEVIRCALAHRHFY
ncbi:uncharacterized protein LOC143906439 [Temnothorax americanus]|uniref:uncharacterized protein LOC143906439 n=1 Tax=Temnothorax americanus TaxID=1964332 RepID=UPI00406919B8